jgi:hypothetical protein
VRGCEGFYTSDRAQEACGDGRGILGEDWPGRAVAGPCRGVERAAHRFWELAAGWEWRNGRADSVHSHRHASVQ